MGKVLVIDDDPDIGRMLTLLLGYKGYSVMLSEKPGKVAETLRNNNIDLLIMDMLLSGINGIDVCVELKQDPTVACIPIIMMSAHPDAKKKCLDGGADRFIAKPFDMQDMLFEVSALLNKKLTV